MRKLSWTVVAFAFSVTTAAAQNPVSDSLRSSWAGAKKNIKESAELMTEANYSFKPSPDVRSFGELLAHVAGASYMICAAAKGEKSPFAEEAFEKTATTKAALVKVTNEAIAYCDGVYAAATDATLGQMVAAPFGSGQVARANPLIMQIGHNNEHYGNLVTYFRIKGIVPPSSRR